MSFWYQLNEAIQASTVVSVDELSLREAHVVQHALNNWADRVISESPAWSAIEALYEAGETSPELTKAVKGLDPREVQLIRHFKGNAKAKPGNTGEVVALSPKDWQRIKQEIESQPEYYDKLLGNIVSSQGLAQKIGDQLALAMGKGPANLSKGNITNPPELSGDPSDPTPIIHNASSHVPTEPSSAQPDEFVPAPSARPKPQQPPTDRFAHLSPSGTPGAAAQAKDIRKNQVTSDKVAVGSGRGKVSVK